MPVATRQCAPTLLPGLPPTADPPRGVKKLPRPQMAQDLAKLVEAVEININIEIVVRSTPGGRDAQLPEPPPRPRMHSSGPRESRPCYGIVGGGGGGSSSGSPPVRSSPGAGGLGDARPAAPRRSAPATARTSHPPPQPRPRSRSHGGAVVEGEWWGGRMIIGIFPAAWLRPPSPEKTPPGRRQWRAAEGTGPAAPEPEGGSAMLWGSDAAAGDSGS